MSYQINPNKQPPLAIGIPRETSSLLPTNYSPIEEENPTSQLLEVVKKILRTFCLPCIAAKSVHEEISEKANLEKSSIDPAHINAYKETFRIINDNKEPFAKRIVAVLSLPVPAGTCLCGSGAYVGACLVASAIMTFMAGSCVLMVVMGIAVLVSIVSGNTTDTSSYVPYQ